MRYEKKIIKIVGARPSDGVILHTEIEANIAGETGLAYHKAVGARKGWAVTHIKSGRQIYECIDEESKDADVKQWIALLLQCCPSWNDERPQIAWEKLLQLWETFNNPVVQQSMF